jgi:hypothetical protein
MTDLILRFLNDLDAALAPEAGGRRLILYHIGRSALVWQYGFAAATADIDVIHLTTDCSPLLEKALRLYGKETAKAAEYNLYLESVPEGLPPVPAGFLGVRPRSTSPGKRSSSSTSNRTTWRLPN